MRNPVIAGGEPSSTDIPDWYFAEFGFDYPMSSSSISRNGTREPPSPYPAPPLVIPKTYSDLHAASPIAYVDSVEVPVLLLIGASDRRVSPTQGTNYYHALKVRYAEKENPSRLDMLVFEGEGHPIDGVEAAKACYEATKQWFGGVVKPNRSA